MNCITTELCVMSVQDIIIIAFIYMFKIDVWAFKDSLALFYIQLNTNVIFSTSQCTLTLPAFFVWISCL